MSKPPKSQIVLITGATRGIGREAALQVARRGHTVLATGRDVERLESLQQEADATGLAIETSRLDVSDAAACEAWTSGATQRHGRIDALVNNAGYGLWGPLGARLGRRGPHRLRDELHRPDAPLPARHSRVCASRVSAPSSTWGRWPGQASSPAGGAYAATKFAMNTMSRSMRLEVGRFGIRVVLLEPGIFETDFVPSQIMAEDMDRETTPYEPLRREEPLPGGLIPWPGPARVARRIRQVIEARHPRARYTVRLRRLPRRHRDAPPPRLRHRLRRPQSHWLVAASSSGGGRGSVFAMVKRDRTVMLCCAPQS